MCRDAGNNSASCIPAHMGAHLLMRVHTGLHMDAHPANVGAHQLMWVHTCLHGCIPAQVGALRSSHRYTPAHAGAHLLMWVHTQLTGCTHCPHRCTPTQVSALRFSSRYTPAHADVHRSSHGCTTCSHRCTPALVGARRPSYRCTPANVGARLITWVHTAHMGAHSYAAPTDRAFASVLASVTLHELWTVESKVHVLLRGTF